MVLNISNDGSHVNPPVVPHVVTAALPLPTTSPVEAQASLENRVITRETLSMIDELIWADRLEEAEERLRDSQKPEDLCLLGSIYIFLGKYEQAAKNLLTSLLAQPENLEAWIWFLQLVPLQSKFTTEGRTLMHNARVELAKANIGQLTRKTLGFTIYWKLGIEMVKIDQTLCENFLQFIETPADRNLIACLVQPNLRFDPSAPIPHLLGRYVLSALFLNSDELVREYLQGLHALNPADTFPLMGLCLVSSMDITECLKWLEKLKQAHAGELIVEVLTKFITKVVPFQAVDLPLTLNEQRRSLAVDQYKFAALSIISCAPNTGLQLEGLDFSYLNQFDAVSDYEILFCLSNLWKRTAPTSRKLALFQATLAGRMNAPACVVLFEKMIPQLKKEKDPNLVHALFEFGKYLEENDELEKSAIYMAQALPLLKDPKEQAVAERVLARVHGEKGDFELARKYASNACHHDPQNAQGFSLLGVFYFATGHFQEAQKWMLRALKLEVSYPGEKLFTYPNGYKILAAS